MKESTFKALSDQTRRDILTMLRKGDMTAGEIASHFRMSKPSISHHLSVLKNAGLVEDVKEGQKVIYSLNLTVLGEIASWIMQLCDDMGEKVVDKQTE